MRTILLAPAVVLLAGCPGFCSASSFSGGSDQVYVHDTEMLIDCEQGGYVAMLSDGNREGMLSQDAGTDGATGEVASGVTWSSDGMEFLGRTWTEQHLNKTELNHANVLCTDLATRPWWAATQASALPVPTGFIAGRFLSLADCKARQAAGSYPANATCWYRMLMCPDGSDFFYSYDDYELGNVWARSSYTASAGTIETGFAETGTFADGQLVSSLHTWTQVDAGSLVGDSIASGVERHGSVAILPCSGGRTEQ